MHPNNFTATKQTNGFSVNLGIPVKIINQKKKKQKSAFEGKGNPVYAGIKRR